MEYDGSSCALAVAEAPLFKNYQLSFWETPNFNENRSITFDFRNSCNLTLTATSPLKYTLALRLLLMHNNSTRKALKYTKYNVNPSKLYVKVLAGSA